MRIYASELISFKREDIIQELLSLNKTLVKARGKMDEVSYDELVIKNNNLMRKVLKLPNKIFTLAVTTDNKPVLFVFDKEPDGKDYDVFWDEKVPYIVVEEQGGKNNV